MVAFDLALTAARAVQLAAVLTVFGACVFQAIVAPFPIARVLRPALIVVAVSAVVWLGLQAAALADAPTVARAVAAIPATLLQTRFGHALLYRLALIALAAVAAATGRVGLASVLAGAGLVVPVIAGHAGGEDEPVALVVAASHMLAAGAWLGGLVPLRLAMGADEGRQAALAARRFSPLGFVCVAVLAATAFWQGRALIGGLAGLVGTEYGRVALVKLGLLAGLLGLAAFHRWVLTPALGAGSPGALRIMRRSLLVETVLGICVVAAASTLASLPPGAHEQPDWPFASRPSLVALAEPEIRHEVAWAVVALGGAILVAVAGIAVWRVRWPALAGAVVIAWFAVPHLRPLLIEAYPTSFYVSPTGFAADSIATGAVLFAANCTRCHGADGRGDGPDGKGLTIPPADLTADHLWDHADGELFWWLTHGMESPEGGLAMPGFAATLSEDARWALIDYIRAHNAGVARRALGSWFRPTPAPGFQAVCGDGTGVSLDALRGRPVRIVSGPPARGVAIADGVVTVFLTQSDPPIGSCVAPGPEVRAAYGVVAGIRADKLDGAWFLVDPQGWLRAFHRPDEGAPPPMTLAAEIDSILAHPIAATSGGVHVHHH